MKLYEWAVLVAVLTLAYGGLILNRSGMLPIAILCWVMAGTLSFGYVYWAKIRPIGMARQAFIAAASRNEFVPLGDKPWKGVVGGLLRVFPGFHSIYLGVSDLQGLQNHAGVFFMGNYAMSGDGLHFGYFMTGVFYPHSRLESLSLNRVLDWSEEFDAAATFACSALPKGVGEVLRTCPCDLHFRNNLFLADYDARHLCTATFGESFDRMIAELSRCNVA
jgi:hypothetical protein